ncbi:MAG: NUDIX hydrolase [Bacteroidetes bacterium]|nr:NUDIX hydrolase [Bacteroidota bacterium]
MHPGLSIDCVIFGFHESELKVLLLKLKNQKLWSLPGGFVDRQKAVDSEAVEVLFRRTGLRDIFLRQFYLFGDTDRHLPGHANKLVATDVIPPELENWFDQRFVSVGYYALVEYSKVQAPRPDFSSDSCTWKNMKDLPDLMLDHEKIIQKAYQILKRELNDQPIGLNLLPDEFSMSELQALYETVLDRKLDRRNFRRKMLSYDILEDTGKRRTGGAHKSPRLYRFNEEKYHKAIEDGLRSLW